MSNRQQELDEKLFKAVEQLDVSEVKALIDDGANVNAQKGYAAGSLFDPPRNRPVLHFALPYWYKDDKAAPVIETLLDAGADIDARDEFSGQTLLMRAASGEHIKIVELLINRGADATIKDENGKTVFGLILEEDSSRFHDIKVLLTQTTAEGKAWLESAEGKAWTRAHEVDDTAPIPTTPAKSISVLRHALTADNKEMQQQITDWVESGGNLDWRAPNGWTLLHLSAQCGNESMIRFLIEHGADIESRAEYGETPLMLACDYRWTDAKIDPSVVKTLLDLGANPNAENHDGRTALSFIFLLDTPEGKEITALLKERGALQIPGISATCPECGAPESSQMRERGVRVTFNGVFAEFPCPGCGVEEQVDRDTIDKRQGVQVLCPSCGVVAHIPPSVWCKTCGSGLSTGWQSSVKKA